MTTNRKEWKMSENCKTFVKTCNIKDNKSLPKM